MMRNKFKFVICPHCEGHGTVEHPAFENGFTHSEMMEWSPEEREHYFAGAYNVECSECKGTGKQRVPNVAAMTFGEKREYVAQLREEREQAAFDRQCRHEMALGY